MTAPSIAFIIDDPDTLNFTKDTSLALMQAASRRHWQTYYTTDKHLYIEDNKVQATWMQLDTSTQHHAQLSTFDIIMMRLEPPVNANYWHICQMLSLLPETTLVVNSPQALRDLSEKLSIYYFPQFIAPTCISNQSAQHLAFLDKHQKIVVKPIDGFGGQNIHTLIADDGNTRALLDNMTQQNSQFILSQLFIDKISEGDKRLFVINGALSNASLTRLPDPKTSLGNLSQGAQPLLSTPTPQEAEMGQTIARWLKEQGILFAGLDSIGGYLTEINITCPTCIQEVKALGGPDLAEQILDAIEHACHKTQ